MSLKSGSSECAVLRKEATAVGGIFENSGTVLSRFFVCIFYYEPIDVRTVPENIDSSVRAQTRKPTILVFFFVFFSQKIILWHSLAVWKVWLFVRVPWIASWTVGSARCRQKCRVSTCISCCGIARRAPTDWRLYNSPGCPCTGSCNVRCKSCLEMFFFLQLFHTYGVGFFFFSPTILL